MSNLDQDSKHFCLCGCGESPKLSQSKYLKGHNRLGYKVPADVVNKTVASLRKLGIYNREKKTKEVICAQCKKIFIVPFYSDHKFCSMHCYWQSLKKEKPEKIYKERKSTKGIPKSDSAKQRMKEGWTEDKKLEKSQNMKLLWISDPLRFKNSSRKGFHFSEEQKSKLRKPENELSRGGYPRIFRKIKLQILSRDKNVCAICGSSLQMVVHHIDWNKENCIENNLISLCRVCHARVHTEMNRQIWEKLLSFLVIEKNRPELICGVDIGSYQTGVSFFGLDKSLFGTALLKSKKKNADDRMIEIASKFEIYVLAYTPKVIYFEAPIFIQNALTTMILMSICGCMKAVCILNNIEFYTVQNRKWKKDIVGFGNAKKTDILKYCVQKWGGEYFSQQDLADAACIGEFGIEDYLKKK